MRRHLVLIPVFVTACAAPTAQPVPIDQVPPGEKCERTGALDPFAGQTASADLGARMLAASRARILRWVPFGAMITMDYNESRLTVRLDQQNRVLSATCG